MRSKEFLEFSWSLSSLRSLCIPYDCCVLVWLVFLRNQWQAGFEVFMMPPGGQRGTLHIAVTLYPNRRTSKLKTFWNWVIFLTLSCNVGFFYSFIYFLFQQKSSQLSVSAVLLPFRKMMRICHHEDENDYVCVHSGPGREVHSRQQLHLPAFLRPSNPITQPFSAQAPSSSECFLPFSLTTSLIINVYLLYHRP